MDMTAERQHRRTHLFTVRLWMEQIAEDHAEVRGRVQHVLSGEVHYFRTWQALTSFFDVTLQEVEGQHFALGDDTIGQVKGENAE
jgi:hypothetical protein